MIRNGIDCKIVVICIIFIVVLIIGRSCVIKYNNRYDIADDKVYNTNEYSTFTAKIKKIEVVNNKIYIVDYDEHVFELSFNPELLLLEDDDLIEMIFKSKYRDNNIIKVDSYNMYGFLSYYGDE